VTAAVSSASEDKANPFAQRRKITDDSMGKEMVMVGRGKQFTQAADIWPHSIDLISSGLS
jgi:hypothetical protein